MVRTTRPMGPFCRAKTCLTAERTRDLAALASAVRRGIGRPWASCGEGMSAGRSWPARLHSSSTDTTCPPRPKRPYWSCRSTRSAVPHRAARHRSSSRSGSTHADGRSRRGSCGQIPEWRDQPPAHCRPASALPRGTSPSSQRASVSFCAALAGSSGPISAALWPVLIAAFSASVCRCRGAAIRLASMICPLGGRHRLP